MSAIHQSFLVISAMFHSPIAADAVCMTRHRLHTFEYVRLVAASAREGTSPCTVCMTRDTKPMPFLGTCPVASSSMMMPKAQMSADCVYLNTTEGLPTTESAFMCEETNG